MNILALAPSSQVTALILAGGQSKRMGTDKALLSWQGKTLLQRVYEVARTCCTRVSIITPWPERYRALLPNSIDWIVESPCHSGPLIAFAQGWKKVSTPWVLLLACDMPCLDATLIQLWIQTLPPSETLGALAYVPYHQSRWEPLCGIYNKEGQPTLNTFINAKGQSFQRWLATIDAVPLIVTEEMAPMLWNCNAPKDLSEQTEK
jgi:molybdenum cofactor guanylyltransferase